jgi:phosphoenolpyruvate carboxykinase (ATP)
MNIAHTRNKVRAAINGLLDDATFVEDPIFRVAVPTSVPGVPDEVLVPRNTWADKDEFDQTARRLAAMFHANFAYYAPGVSGEIRTAGPVDVGEVDLGNFKFSKPGEG